MGADASVTLCRPRECADKGIFTTYCVVSMLRIIHALQTMNHFEMAAALATRYYVIVVYYCTASFNMEKT